MVRLVHTSFLFLIFTSQLFSQPQEAFTVTIDTTDVLVENFDGWGVSLAWWAKIAGEHLSDRELDAVADQLLNDAKYNYFRYDIGGGDNPAHDHMREGGDIEGYPQLGNDRQQIRVLKAVARAASKHNRPVHFEAISYSPPYEMTKSGCTAGNAEGTDNLKEDRYGDFANYLANAVKYLNEEVLKGFSQNGRSFKMEKLAPYNEPQSDWWKENGNQEGCPFSTANQVRLLPLVRKALDSVGQRDIKIVVNEANSIEEAVEAAAFYQQAGVLNLIDEYAIHTYAGLPYRNAMLEVAHAQNKKIVVSETGPLNVQGSSAYVYALMAQRIIQDINYLNAEVWFDWQAYSTHDHWCLYRQAPLKNHLKDPEVSRQLYYRQQFTHFIPPGAKILNINPPSNVLVAKKGNDLAIVTTNLDDQRSIRYDIQLPTARKLPIVKKVQQTTSEVNFIPFDNYEIEGNSLSFVIAPLSVISFMIEFK